MDSLDLADIMILSSALRINHVMRCFDVNTPPRDLHGQLSIPVSQQGLALNRDVLRVYREISQLLREAERLSKTSEGSSVITGPVLTCGV